MPEETSGLNNTVAESHLGSVGPYKLLLQDCVGTSVYGFELERVREICGEMAIGAKIVLKNVLVARGLVLLTPGTVEVLGGKVDEWDRKWREERVEVLKKAANMEGRNQG